jgi:hypothetical protein
VQFDRPLGGSGAPATLSIGGGFQHDVATGFASVTLHLPNSGVKVPIGISWSNRTELVTGTAIRGHIGFHFDTHTLAK